VAIGQLRFDKVLRLSVLVSVAVLCCTWQAAGSNNRCVDQLPFGETKGKNFLQVDRKYRNKCSCSTSQFYMAFRFSVCFGPPASSGAVPCQMAVIKHKQHVVGEGISNIMEVPLGTIDERCVVLQKLGMTTI